MNSELARTLNRITVTKPIDGKIIVISMTVYLLTTDLDKQSLKRQIEYLYINSSRNNNTVNQCNQSIIIPIYNKMFIHSM